MATALFPFSLPIRVVVTLLVSYEYHFYLFFSLTVAVFTLLSSYLCYCFLPVTLFFISVPSPYLVMLIPLSN